MDSQEYYQQLKTDRVIVVYKGAATSGLLDSILTVTENKLSAYEQRSKLRRKVYTIIVEVLQNIYHHFEVPEAVAEADSIIFVLEKSKEHYWIISGNYVHPEEREGLRGRIEKINTLSPEELKTEYRQRLSEEHTAKGGAGLGLLDIARRSGQKLDYEFTEQGGEAGPLPFFTLKVKVPA